MTDEDRKHNTDDFRTISSYNGDMKGALSFGTANLKAFVNESELYPACVYIDKEMKDGESTGLYRLTIYVDTQE